MHNSFPQEGSYSKKETTDFNVDRNTWILKRINFLRRAYINYWAKRYERFSPQNEASSDHKTALYGVMMGGVHYNVMNKDPDELVQSVLSFIESEYGIDANPNLVTLKQVPNAIPQYLVGHSS